MPLKPAHYAVIGNPIAQSRSPEIHARFAEQTGVSLHYERILAPLDAFAATVAGFRAAGGVGLNVTVPFKTEAYAYATHRTERAEQAGAVNTLRWTPDGVWGDNTDGVGLVDDITQRVGLAVHDARVLVVGAGGAARGVVWPLLAAGAARVHVANRTLAKAQAWVVPMTERLGAQGARLSCGALDALEPGFDWVINATSAGLVEAGPILPHGVWSNVQLALDMVYAAQPTPFMRQAQAAGCARVEDGFGMLVSQAAAAFEWWWGMRPNTAPVYHALRP